MKNNQKKWLWWGGGIAVLIILVLIAKSRGGVKGEKIAVEKSQKRTITETVSASGRIFPEKEIKISSDVSGEIVQLMVKEGDSISVGQLLARVNPEIYEDQVARGEAGVNTSKAQAANAQAAAKSSSSRQTQLRANRDQIAAQLENAQTSLQRSSKLYKEGVISTAELETAQAQVRQLEANLRSAEANIVASQTDFEGSEAQAKAAEYGIKSSEASLRELKKSLRKTEIYAPASGIVSKMNVEKGERVVGTAQMSGTEMMRIANLNAMEVQVNISENDILKVLIGNEVDIEVDAYTSRKFKGTVTEIAKTASNATTSTGALNLSTDQVTNFVVKIRIDAASYSDLMKGKSGAPFLPGMSASVDIKTNTVSDVVTVPIQSVTTREAEDLISDSKGKTKKTTQSNPEDNETVTAKDTKKEVKISEIKEVVFVYSADTVRAVVVKTGVQDSKYIQITEGLKPDEEVVAAPYNLIARKLKMGTKVQKVTEKELYEKKE